MISIPGIEIISQLHRGSRVGVYRGRMDENGATVIVKVLEERFPSSLDLARFRKEYELTRELEIGCAVKSLSFLELQNSLAIIFENFDGEPLNRSEHLRGLDLKGLLELSLSITEGLGQIHGRNIIHKDINPSNILWNFRTGDIRIIDFGISTRLSRENPEVRSPDFLEGTLAYMSPEQTGRMNRPIDYRTDLYSLGATFYYLFTGMPPFLAEDAMGFVFSHIARSPEPVNRVNPDIPEPISGIVEKLMAKSAEDRYQSTFGLQRDLRYCIEALGSTGVMQAFEIGQNDRVDLFQTPRKLYGREAQIEQLRDIYARVVDGAAEALLVAGPPGVGKTGFVNEMSRIIIENEGYFITGKFDQLQRNIPHESLIQAFGDLIRQLLSENEDKLAAWKKALTDALDGQAGLLMDFIPDLELIIGKQPPVRELSLAESQARFNNAFSAFVQVFASKDHPLVIFLDDLQWAEPATLASIERLVTDPDASHLLFIGAYRDNDPGMGDLSGLFPWKAVAENLVTNQILLEPLTQSHVYRLLSDTLPRHDGDLGGLASLIYRKTHGIPLFINEFKDTLYREGIIRFDYEKDAWTWDVERIKAMGFTENVVELLVNKVRKLDGGMRRMLTLAACMGNRFELEMMALASGQSVRDTFATLLVLVKEDLLVPVGSIYETVSAYGRGMDGTRIPGQKTIFKFYHDRVQQAAYGFLSGEEKKGTHLEIGRLLLSRISRMESDELLFQVLHHFRIGLDLIHEESEKKRLARLFLAAGEKARSSNAYDSAYSYLRRGIDLLPPDSRETERELTLSLFNRAAICEYVLGNVDGAKARYETLLENSSSVLEKVTVYNHMIAMYHYLGKYDRALDIGKTALALLNVKIPAKCDKKVLLPEIIMAKLRLGKRSGQYLLHLPPLSDPSVMAVMDIMASISTALSFVEDPDQVAYVIMRMLNLTLKYGYSDRHTPYALAAWGLFLCSGTTRYREGHEFGKLAVKTAEECGDTDLICKTNFLFARGINHWSDHARTNLQYHKTAYEAGVKTGNPVWASWAAIYMFLIPYITAEPLEKIPVIIEDYYPFINHVNYPDLIPFFVLTRQMVRCLRGETKNFGDFDDNTFDEVSYGKQVLSDCQLPFTKVWYFTMKTQAFYLAGRFSEALAMAEKAEEDMDSIRGIVGVPEHYFYYSLALTSLYPSASKSDRRKYRRRLRSHLKKFKKWSEAGRENFHHKYLLIKAQTEALFGNPSEAVNLYERAIASADQAGYIQNQAIANECAARFFLGRENRQIAKMFMSNACYGYHRWGALAKVARLEEEFSWLEVSSKEKSLDCSTPELNISSGEAASELDQTSMLKASRAISGEIMLGTLLERMLEIMMENAGARRIVFIMKVDGAWKIEAESKANDNRISVLQSIPIHGNPDIPNKLINFVVRKAESIILEDASQKHLFSDDPYFKSGAKKSILCMPVLYQRETMGILFLENNLITGAFTPKRVQLLHVLSSQAAISIENARLYAEVDKSEKKFRRLFENATEGIFQTASDGRLFTVNSALSRMLGYDSPQELLKKITDRTRHPFTNPEDSQNLTSLLRSHGKVRNFETLFNRKDGSTVEVSINAHVVYDENGNQLFQEGSIDDITQKKITEKLRVEKEVAEAATRTKTEFLANMSHDIRTPINAITGFTELVACTPLNAKQKDYIRKIRSSSQSLLSIVNDILDFTKIDVGKMCLEKIDFSLDGLLEHHANIFSHRIVGGNVDMVMYVEEEVPTALIGDPNRLGQVLMNLIDNALKFTAIGQILVRVSLVEKSADSAHIRFSVTDTGIGVSEEQIKRIFTFFEQADISTTRAYGGFGLGLHICKRLIDMMDGEISVNGSPGKGSTFAFTARFQCNPEQEHETRCALPDALKELPVLIIGDNRIVDAYLAKLIKSLHLNPSLEFRDVFMKKGVSDFYAKGHSQALLLINCDSDFEKTIQIVQKVNDFKKRQEQTDSPRRLSIKTVVIVPFGQEKLKEKLQSSGADAFVVKPATKFALLDAALRAFGFEPNEKPDFKLSTSDFDPDPDFEISLEKIQNARILLVEDNPLNQEVAMEILESKGCIPDLAKNGLEGVNAVLARSYDAVLMDLQMPVMDGYEATRRIRMHPRCKNLPIIAMTAHALDGFKEKCLQAGMDDYITKPFYTPHLVRTLAKHVTRVNGKPMAKAPENHPEKLMEKSAMKPAEKMAPEPKPLPSKETILPDSLPGIDVNGALKLLENNPTLLKNLLIGFHDHYSNAMAQITAAIGNKDYQTAGKLVHSMKSPAGSLSAKTLVKASEELENWLNGDRKQNLEKLLGDFEQALNQVRKAGRIMKESDGLHLG